MRCEQLEQRLGPYVDDELSATVREAVERHLASCADCRRELDDLRELVEGIARPPGATVPKSVWAGVEQRLDEGTPTATGLRPARTIRLWTRRWAMAAGLFLAVGLGMLGLSSLDTTTQASTVDFGVLLDALPLDAQKAFTKFLVRYDAKPITPVAAKRIAPNLNFDTPSVLPGGFRLQAVFQIRIGGARGIAASYNRDGEFLAVVFHPPMKHESFGSHENYPCVIGKHCGHKVQVGEWKLVHLTDPTTCHCLLSRLDEKTEIPAVMKAIAPQLGPTASAHEH